MRNILKPVIPMQADMGLVEHLAADLKGQLAELEIITSRKADASRAEDVRGCKLSFQC